MLLAGLRAVAHAQSPLGIGTAEPAFKTTGIFGGLLAWMNMEQQRFYHTLTAAIKGMRENPWQLWSLIGLSFAYGVFHAAGPGHGKAVISSYMIANETELKRGVLLSFLSSMMQGGVAILLVGAAYLVLRGSSHLDDAGDAFSGNRELRADRRFRRLAAFSQAARAAAASPGAVAVAATGTAISVPMSTTMTAPRHAHHSHDHHGHQPWSGRGLRHLRPCACARSVDARRATASRCGKPGRRSSPSACGPAPAR